MKFVYCLVVLFAVAVNADEPENKVAEPAELAEPAAVEAVAEASQPKPVNLLLISKPILTTYKPKLVKPILSTSAPLLLKPKPALLPAPSQPLKKKPTLATYKPSIKPTRNIIIAKPIDSNADNRGAYVPWSEKA